MGWALVCRWLGGGGLIFQQLVDSGDFWRERKVVRCLCLAYAYLYDVMDSAWVIIGGRKMYR